MILTQKQLERFVYLTSNSDYNEDLKHEFRNLGRRVLKFIAEQMELQPTQYDIRWNPGGIACSGDHTLHTDKVYLALHDNLGLGWFYWRTCQGRKDYSGGPNQNVQWREILRPGGLANLIVTLKRAQGL